ncbi:MAG TPA: hypothetical protein VK808_00840 [Bacteroidia bacterium]|jgi:hypothetical protein|nr:hypothetical protein [Bacteroidia bacterium]
MKKKLVAAGIVLAFATGVLATSAFTSIEKQNEAKKHPRIEKAIDDMYDALDYMEHAPDTFGGHKAAAMADTRAAIKSLKAALGYRYHEDHK